MPVTNETSEVTYEGNGAATEFSFNFFIPSGALTVYTSDRLTETLVDPADYTVTGLGNKNGGAVTYSPSGGPLASGTHLVIRRAIPYTQKVDLENQQRFFPSVVGSALDRAVLLIQQVRTDLGKMVRVPAGSALTPETAYADLLTARDEAVAAAGEVADLQTWKGAWADATEYEKNDVVQNTGSAYIATTEHTASSANEPGVGGDWETVWDLMVAAGEILGGVPQAREVNTGTGLVGGGDLSADRTFAADIASKAQAETGTDNTKLMTPLRVAQSVTENAPAPAQLSEAQAADPNSTVFGTVSGERLEQAVAETAVFTKFYESSEQTIVVTGSLTLSHGLGSAPKLTQALLICKTAEFGYSVGNIVHLNETSMNTGGNETIGIVLVPDATDIFIRFSNRFAVFTILNKSTGSLANLSESNWRLIVRAWA